jgi:hypothetical protein
MKTRGWVIEIDGAPGCLNLSGPLPARYELNNAMDALANLRDVLSLIRIAVRASLDQPLTASALGVSVDLR